MLLMYVILHSKGRSKPLELSISTLTQLSSPLSSENKNYGFRLQDWCTNKAASAPYRIIDFDILNAIVLNLACRLSRAYSYSRTSYIVLILSLFSVL